jgi:nicotinamide-nucleotide amidase
VALLGESAVVSLLADVEAAAAEDASVDIAYLARPAHVSVRVSVADDDAERARRRLGEWEARVTATLGHHVLGRQGVTLPEVVVAALVSRHATAATAESLTGGAVAAALTSVPGASQVVRGGLVTYATELKASMLGVSPDLLAERGPVDESVAVAMAVGVRRSVAADWGVATTGVAGPDPVGAHAPGHVHIAVSGPGGETTRTLDLPGDRARVRRLSVAHALDELRLRLEPRESADPSDRWRS